MVCTPRGSRIMEIPKQFYYLLVLIYPLSFAFIGYILRGYVDKFAKSKDSEVKK